MLLYMEVVAVLGAIIVFRYCMMAYITRSNHVRLEGVPVLRKYKHNPPVRNSEGYFVDSSGNIML